MDDVRFKVYGDDQSGVTLHCWDCGWHVMWPEGVILKELDAAATTHYFKEHHGN